MSEFQCTFVTAYYRFPGVPKRENMLERGLELVSVAVPLVIYCDSEFEDQFRQQREQLGLAHLSRIVARPHSDLPAYKYRDTVERNRAEYWPTRDPRSPTDVHLVQLSKFALCQEVAEWNPFECTHVGWLDFRIVSETRLPTQLVAIAQDPRPRFTVSVLNCWSPTDYVDLREFYNQYRWIAAGGLWTVERTTAARVLPRLIEHVDRVTNAGYGHGDEAFFAFTIDEMPEEFTLNVGDYADLTANYYGARANLGYVEWVLNMYIGKGMLERARKMIRDARIMFTPLRARFEEYIKVIQE